MAGETIVTVVGNLTADPELRFTPSGAAVANFAIASTPRFFDRQANEWKDAETLFVRCSLWREAAENAAESLTKGTRVIAQGQLKARSFQTKEGENRTSWELEVEEIGPSLRYATTQVNRSAKGQSGGFRSNAANTFDATANNGGAGFGNSSSTDPWGTGGAATNGWPATSEPDF